LNPDCLRYYFAAKLGPVADDIDLNFDDFAARINADLVGKLVNIASRCAGFIHRLGDGMLAAELQDTALLDVFSAEGRAIAADYDSRNYSKAIRRIMALADRANQYIDEQKPWIRAKDTANTREVIAICTLGLNLFRYLIIYLKPVVPELAERSEAFLAVPPLVWTDAQTPLLGTRIEKFQNLLQRIDPKDIEAMVNESREVAAGQAQPSGDGAESIDFETFARVDMRVAKVMQASYVEGADKLLQLEVDLGTETRQIFSGIRSAYQPEELEGRLVIVVANLQPRKMRFGTSDGMVLAAGDGGKEVFLLGVDSGAQPGMKVT
jgi:methionyl-tRNA synthetase